MRVLTTYLYHPSLNASRFSLTSGCAPRSLSVFAVLYPIASELSSPSLRVLTTTTHFHFTVGSLTRLLCLIDAVQFCMFSPWMVGSSLRLGVFPSFVHTTSPAYTMLLCTEPHVYFSTFHMYSMHSAITDLPMQSHSRKIDLSGRLGARSEINFTALPSNVADSSDEDIPLKQLSLSHIREKVETLFDQDSLCLSTVNNLLSPSESEDSSEVEIVTPSTPPEQSAPPADAFTWPPTNVSPAGKEPAWVRDGPTPDGPAFTCGWPPFSGTVPRQRHRDAQRYNPAHARKRENAASHRRQQFSPIRRHSRSPPPIKPQVPSRRHEQSSSRCLVKINFPQIGRSMNQIMDKSQTIDSLITACRTEWNLGPNAIVTMTFGHDKECLTSTLIGNYIPRGQDHPAMDFFLNLKGYFVDLPSDRSKTAQSASGFTWLGPHDPRSNARRDYHAPSPKRSRDDPHDPRSTARRDCHAPSPKRSRDDPEQHQAARRADRSRIPYRSARREQDSSRQDASNVPDLPFPASKAAPVHPFPPPFPYGKASAPHGKPLPPRPFISPSRSKSVDSFDSLEIDEDIDMNGSDNDVTMDKKEDVRRSTHTRSDSEKRRYAAEQRAIRDLLLVELNEAWRYLLAPPPPDAAFLSPNSWRPELQALLVKGHQFATLATRIGCSAAAKAVRNNFKKRGRKYQAGADDFYDAIFRFNERLMPPSRDA